MKLDFSIVQVVFQKQADREARGFADAGVSSIRRGGRFPRRQRDAPLMEDRKMAVQKQAVLGARGSADAGVSSIRRGGRFPRQRRNAQLFNSHKKVKLQRAYGECLGARGR